MTKNFTNEISGLHHKDSIAQRQSEINPYSGLALLGP
jgi:hypothetical protein